MLNNLLLRQQESGKLYIEDVMSSYLYTGNGSTQTITNGIDLAGRGGMVWVKSRSAATNHFLFDTARGVNVEINSNTTDANATLANSVTAFNSTGFALGSAAGINVNAATYASWTFRKAPKFFDVVTYTGDGNASTDTPSPFGRGIPHSLGVKPGFVVIKRTDAAGDWHVAAQKSGSTEWFAGRPSVSQPFALNSTNAATFTFNGTSQVYATGTAFYPAWIAGGGNLALNISGATYVAYLFAHDPSADGVIQCGSYTGNGSVTGPTVNLGWEPQWLMIKNAGGTGSWKMIDNMRGMPVKSNPAAYSLAANTSDGEENFGYLNPTSTGFEITTNSSEVNTNGSAYVYIAIRRGPMKTPTLGTSVFAPVVATPTGSDPYITTMTTNFPVDLTMSMNRDYGTSQSSDRLRGGTKFLVTNNANAEQDFTSATWPGYTSFDSNTAITQRVWSAGYGSIIGWNFRRAPGFFDMVCYTGTGAARTVSHNLGVAPELMILKSRSGAGTIWYVYSSQLGIDKQLKLNTVDTAASGFSGILNNTVPSATTFSLATANSDTNESGTTYVAYLFASTPGVSKVGSYTGNGSSQTINCGFSNGARFFLVKRTNASGDWWVYDSARGIVSAADRALRLNSTAAEVTSADAVDPDSTGIIVNQEATCNINVNGATYIYLAIA